MSEIQAPLTPQPTVYPVRRQSNTWLWIVLTLAALVVIPSLACVVFVAAASTGGGGVGPAVGVIRVEGTIMAGDSADGIGGSVVGADTIVDLLEQANADPDVKAIVLRIDSPGGGVVASDEIHHALTQVDKPIVVSMGTMAASGGYYIAAPADHIFATPHTLTGSIGVISEFIVAEEFLDDLGVEIVVVAAGDMKDFGSPNREMTQEELTYWQDLLNRTHESFIQVVVDGRGMDVEAVRALADGRVFDGGQALELGLVDEIGYFQDAVERAAELGGIEGTPRILEFEPQTGFLDALYGYQSSQQATITMEFFHQLSVPSMQFRYIGPQE